VNGYGTGFGDRQELPGFRAIHGGGPATFSIA
jgi:hypothetical protein